MQHFSDPDISTIEQILFNFLALFPTLYIIFHQQNHLGTLPK